MSKRTTEIEIYFSDGCGRCEKGGTPACKVHVWQDELQALRVILQESELTEEVKWGCPCYTWKKKNVVMLSALKEYCSLSFFKGALLKDPKKILQKAGENSQVARLFKFTNTNEIVKLESIIKAYISEAIEIENAGLKVETKANPEPVPEELQAMFDEQPDFKSAFYALTLGRQRGYILYFSQPKQSKTRVGRIEKYRQQIFDGVGLHDKYQCGKK